MWDLCWTNYSGLGNNMGWFIHVHLKSILLNNDFTHQRLLVLFVQYTLRLSGGVQTSQILYVIFKSCDFVTIKCISKYQIILTVLILYHVLMYFLTLFKHLQSLSLLYLVDHVESLWNLKRRGCWIFGCSPVFAFVTKFVIMNPVLFL
jgi:hypothetical protein